MANLVLNQALTPDQLANIKATNLPNIVRWIAQLSIEDTTDEFINFIFKVGMPGKFANGEWGYFLVGNSGMHVIPEADKLDHRTSFRYAPIPNYTIKQSSLWGVTAPMTIYERELRLNEQDPELVKNIHLAAVRAALPNYWKYLSFMLFSSGDWKTKGRPILRDYIAKYIEPSNGSTEGYPFYLSKGYGEINLTKVINKANTKVTQHKLKTELERINKLLYNDTRKVEVQTSEYVDKKKVLKDNLTEASLKTLAMYYKIWNELNTVLMNRQFDSKYKIDSTKFEGYNAPINSGDDLILVMNASQWRALQMDLTAIGEGTFDISLGKLPCRVFLSHDIPQNEALLMHKDLLQCWIIPSETRYINVPYVHEETIDHFYEVRHSLDVVPFYPCMWFKLKA